MKIYILGAGPAGLAMAHALSEAKIPFEVIEKSPQIGGLATSLDWKNHGRHDLGPHKIFSLNAELVQRVKSLLPEDQWLLRPKKSSIYMRGHFLPYPPSPFSLISVYGIGAFIRMTLDYGIARIRNLFGSINAKTFEEDLEHRVGSSLYKVLFLPIALKLWGNPKQLDVKLSLGRVQTPKLTEVLARLAGLKKSSEFEALSFFYPQGGLIKIWTSILDKTKGYGKFHLNSQVTKIESQDGQIRKITYSQQGQQHDITVNPEDFVFSTLPLKVLAESMPSFPQSYSKTIQDTVVLNDLTLVFLKLKEQNMMDDSWVFIPDPEVIFHRISEQESFDPSMTPNGTIVCCEIMNSETRPIDKYTEQQLIDMTIQDLKKMGYGPLTVEDTRVIRLPQSYPVFRPGYESKLKDILQHLDQYKNLRTVGRQGAFNYIGTLDAMDIGYGAAQWVSQKKTTPSWNSERQRTEHFPILD